MKVLLKTAVICGAVAVALSSAQAQDVTFRMGLGSSKPHPFNTAGELFAAKVDELSNGSMEIEIFPDRQLGDVKELTEGVRFGTVDMTISSSAAMADHIPGINALQLPFLVNGYGEFADLVVTPEGQALYKGLDKSGAVALTIYEGGQRHFLTIDKPVASMDDFKGLKTRVAPVKLHLDIFKALGTNPTPMAYGEVYTGLETHALDAVETNISSIAAEKYSEVAKNVLLTGHYFWPGLLMVNKAKFDSLTPEQQDILRQAALQTVKPQIQALDDYDRDLMGTLEKDAGVKFTEPTPEMRAQMIEAVQPVYDAYMDSDPTIAPFVAKAKEIGGKKAD
jgi:tripartite ATP-independent transporter DctP family solute receptor